MRDPRTVTRAVDAVIRTSASLRGLAVQLAALSFFLWILIVARDRLTDLLLFEYSQVPARQLWLFIGFCAALTLSYGAWLTAGFAHLGRWLALLLGSGALLILSFLALPWTADAIDAVMTNWTRNLEHPRTVPRPREDELLAPMLAAMIQCVVVFGGVPLGIGLLRIDAWVRRTRWRIRRRWRRRRRL